MNCPNILKSAESAKSPRAKQLFIYLLFKGVNFKEALFLLSHN